MIEVVATNIVASQPPERQPTGMPPNRANWMVKDERTTDIIS